MLDTELRYFAEHRQELLQQFPGKFIVVKEETVLGPFDTLEDALASGTKHFGLTSFLVRRTDEQPTTEISIPALTLGILRARPDAPASRRDPNS